MANILAVEPNWKPAGVAVGLVDGVVDRRLALAPRCWSSRWSGTIDEDLAGARLDHRGRGTDACLLPTGTRFSRSFWASFWICGSSVVWMVRPPRLMFLMRSAIGLAQRGLLLEVGHDVVAEVRARSRWRTQFCAAVTLSGSS